MKKNIALLIFLILSITYVVSANRTIRGVIKDQSDEPIIGATIQLKGTTLGTVTNIDGEFSLFVPEGYGTLTVQFIGLESQDITLDNKDFYEIILREDNTALNEVVVVGYGSRVMRSMTGAAMSVSSAGLQASANGKKKAGTTWKRSGMADNSIRLQVGDGDFIPLESAQMAVQIDGFRVRVLLDCFFYNNKKSGLEGTFKLKLPTDATPYYFAFGETEYLDDETKQTPFAKYTPDEFELRYKDIENMNDREWDDVKEARIVSKQKAAKAYEQTVYANVDPALMEWGGADMFSCRVFPLEMNTLHRIVIGYDLNMTEALDFREFILSLPKVEKDLQVNLSLSDSPNQPMEVVPLSKDIVKENERLYITYNNPKEKEIKIYNNSIAPVVLAQDRDIDSDDNNDYFASTFRIHLPEQEQRGLATDAVFLLDVSLSSSPDKFNVWLKLMDEILSNNSDIIKRFAVLTFDIDNNWYEKHFQRNNYYNRERFLEYANTLALEGATNVGAALKEASNPSWLKTNNPKHIFVMSDGDFNWGEVNKHTFTDFIYKGDKIHTYKTGLSGTNIGLLDFLSRSTDGFSFTVTGEEEAKQTAKSFRYKPWKIENIAVEGVEDFLISGSPSQLYNGQKLIFTRRQIPQGDITIKVNNGTESQTLTFATDNKVNSSLASRIYGQIALAYLDNYGYKAEEAAVNYSTFYKVPGQYTSFLMLENDWNYEDYGIDDYDAKIFVRENIVAEIVKTLEESEASALLGDPKTNFLAWLKKLEDTDIVDFETNDEFNAYVNNLPDDIFKVQLNSLKTSVQLAEQQTYQEQEVLADEDLRFDKVFKLAKKRSLKGDKLKLLSSVVERNASDIQAIRDIAMAAIDWGMGDQAYYMMKRIIDWRQGEAIAYLTAADALAKSGNIDMAIVYYYISLNSDWDGDYGDFKLIAALECLKFINQISDPSKYNITKSTKEYLAIFKKEVEEMLDQENMLFNEADIVITLSWNVNDTDIDLHVIEPTGEECYYSNRETEIGGKLTKDVTRGYGPEMYVLEKATPGVYKISLKYYSGTSTKTASKAKCYINIYRDWGRKNEKVTKKTIILEDVKTLKDVLKFKL